MQAKATTDSSLTAAAAQAAASLQSRAKLGAAGATLPSPSVPTVQISPTLPSATLAGATGSVTLPDVAPSSAFPGGKPPPAPTLAGPSSFSSGAGPVGDAAAGLSGSGRDLLPTISQLGTGAVTSAVSTAKGPPAGGALGGGLERLTSGALGALGDILPDLSATGSASRDLPAGLEAPAPAGGTSTRELNLGTSQAVDLRTGVAGTADSKLAGISVSGSAPGVTVSGSTPGVSVTGSATGVGAPGVPAVIQPASGAAPDASAADGVSPSEGSASGGGLLAGIVAAGAAAITAGAAALGLSGSEEVDGTGSEARAVYDAPGRGLLSSGATPRNGSGDFDVRASLLTSHVLDSGEFLSSDDEGTVDDLTVSLNQTPRDGAPESLSSAPRTGTTADPKPGSDAGAVYC
jgi:hypothetical protein